MNQTVFKIPPAFWFYIPRTFNGFLFFWFICFMALPVPGARAEKINKDNTEVRELRKVVDKLKRRIEVLERQNEVNEKNNSKTKSRMEPPEENIIHSSNTEGKPLPPVKELPKPPSDDINFSFGGQIIIEAAFNWPSSPAVSDNDLFPNTLPTTSAGESGQFAISSRDTRLWFKTSSLTRLGPFKTLIEIDFKGTTGAERINNSHQPRMRHAYGILGNLAIGQTESTFANLEAWPDTTPEAIGHISNRQPMVRWTQKMAKDFDIQFAFENPETTLTNSAGTRITPGDDRVPDLAVKARWYTDRFSLALSGLLREIRSDGGVAPGVEDSEVGGALYFSGKWFTRGRNNIRFGLSGGNALGRYASSNSFNDGSIDANGQIELHMVYLGYLSYQHWFNKNWRIATTASHVQTDNDVGRVPANSIKNAQSYHLRVSWLPLLRTIFSAEYLHAMSELENGLDGQQDRLQFSARYRF